MNFKINRKVAIFRDDDEDELEYICGGSIITENAVLTGTTIYDIENVDLILYILY